MSLDDTGSPLLTQFFETVERQLCKQKTVLLEELFSTNQKNETTKLFFVLLENRVSRGLPEQCFYRT